MTSQLRVLDGVTQSTSWATHQPEPEVPEVAAEDPAVVREPEVVLGPEVANHCLNLNKPVSWELML